MKWKRTYVVPAETRTLVLIEKRTARVKSELRTFSVPKPTQGPGGAM